MADQDRRRAARVATLGAVPAALAAGVLSLWGLGALSTPVSETPVSEPTPPPATSAPAPTAPVPMTANALHADAANVCRAVVTALPEAIREHRRRPVTAGPDHNAAYGEPPITLACGVPAVEFPLTAELAGLNGVCWYARPSGAGTVWTTVDRVVPVRVVVPGPAAGSAQSVIPLTAAIAAGDPPAPAATIPSGCNP